MELHIYSQNGILKLTVSPNSSSVITEELMGECSVSAGFIYYEYVPLEVGDYILIESVRYSVKSQYRPTKGHGSKYVYQVKFWAPIHDAEDTLFLFTIDEGMQSEFSYDATPQEHLQLWVDNMNRKAGSAIWSLGTVINGKSKTISYKNMSCWDAAFSNNGIAVTFDTEMWADGFIVNLCKAERGVRVPLGYMHGLTKLVPSQNSDVKFFTRLYPLGSTRNIDAHKYGYGRLQLPSKAKYVDKQTDIYGIKEGYEESAFADIYPRYVGTVSSVRTETKTNQSNREYTVYFIQDSDINFNPDEYELPEHVKRVSFQTGDLAGRGDAEGSFEANWIESSKEWEIINVYPDETSQLPGGVLVPKVGDTYIPWNFSMPIEYNTAAEKEFEVAVNTYLENCSFDPTKYEGQTDRNYIAKNDVDLMIGLNVKLLSEEYFTNGYHNSRVVKLSKKLNDLSQVSITCSDRIERGWKSRVDSEISDLKYGQSSQGTVSLNLIGTGDGTTPSDNNAFSALRSLSMFLRKDIPEKVSHLFTCLKGIRIGQFVRGMIGGSGAQIDKDGNAEMQSLILRESLVVPSITFNCIDVVSGDKANTFAYGTILKVVEDEVTDPNILTGTAWLELLEDERGTLAVDDLCRGIFHNIGGNNTALGEDTNGFYKYSGFSTAYFTPTSIVENAKGVFSFKYVLQAGTSVHPMKGMKFFAYGNMTDPNRQSITYENRDYRRILADVSDWIIDPDKHIKMQSGLLGGMVIGGMTMQGYGTFLDNVYLTGAVIQFTKEEQDKLSAYSVNLASETGVLRLDQYGVVAGSQQLKTVLSVNRGSVNLQYSDIIGEGFYKAVLTPVGCQATIAKTGEITITHLTEGGYVDIVVNCEGFYTIKKRYSIYTVHDGKDAEKTTVYEIITDAPVIKKHKDGTYNVTRIEGNVLESYGMETAVCAKLPAGFWMEVWIDGMRDVTINAGTSPSFGVSTADIAKELKLILYKSVTNPDGTHKTVLVDSEIVPLLTDGDGESPLIISLSNDNASLECDSDGNIIHIGNSGYIKAGFQPTTTAVLYHGTQPVRIDTVSIKSQSGNVGEVYYVYDNQNYPTAATIYIRSMLDSSLDREAVNITLGGMVNAVRMSRTATFYINKVKNGKQGQDGKPGKYMQDIYIVSNDKPARPASAGIPAGWTFERPLLDFESFSYTTTGNWMKIGDLYRSEKIDDYGFTTMRFNFSFDKPTWINVTMTAHSDLNYDLGYIGKLDKAYTKKPVNESEYSTKVSGNGVDGHAYILVPAGSHFVEVMYGKDSGGGNFGDSVDCRVAMVKRIWKSSSEAQIQNDGSIIYAGWSEVELYNVQSGEERIFLLTKLLSDMPAPFSDPDIDNYLPAISNDTYDAAVTYLPERKIYYQSKAYSNIKQCKGILPTNAEYWEETPEWTAEPKSVDTTYRVQYVCVRKQLGSVWGGFSKPVVYSIVGKGQDGVDGAMPRYCGEYKDGVKYVYDTEYRDVVLLNHQVYQVKNRYSSVSTVPSAESKDWEMASKFSFVAMNTALIEGANIGGLFFRNEKLVSKDGESIVIDGATGQITAKKAHITGVIESIEGTIGGFTITGSSIKNTSPEGGLCLMNNCLLFERGSNRIGIGDCWPPSTGLTGIIGMDMIINIGNSTHGNEIAAMNVEVSGGGTALGNDARQRAIRLVTSGGNDDYALDFKGKIKIRTNSLPNGVDALTQEYVVGDLWGGQYGTQGGKKRMKFINGLLVSVEWA